MSHYHLIVGSMMGTAESVADHLNEQLIQRKRSSTLHTKPKLEDFSYGTWIICTSTHGAGDFPDNILPFSQQLISANLNHIEYLLIGLGDSQYDTFCQAAKGFLSLMNNSGALLLKEPLYIDAQYCDTPEQIAIDWLTTWLDHVEAGK